ncbi:hypothetical protein PV04_09114 [Phialophora macrospora]|uniref:DNA-directed RNA polymerase III subunit RPC4 n=1 Tax=Phialophora macrospora TaxID=1851006 RepID=A0A0D2CG74_9EURO|nr:hypothetical protein PV04_09114 [Phialophora macrospora]
MPDPPAASTSKPTTRGRGAPRPRGAIQRKSKAEREQFLKEEAERQKARAAEHEASSRGARGGGRAVNRGRGGTTPAQRSGPVAGGGVFGGGGGLTSTQSKQKYEGYAELLEGGVSRRGPEDGLQGDGDAGGAGGSKRSGGVGTSMGGGARAPTAGETIETTSDDERDDGPKRDIERIWISSDEDEGEDDDAIMSSSRKGKQKATATTIARRSSRSGAGLRPVRAPRTMREEEDQAGRNTTASRKKPAHPSKRPDVDTQEISSDEHRERDGDPMEIDMDINREDSVQVIKEQPSSPELRKRALRKQPGVPSRHGPLKAFANETLEERAERLRVQDDVDKLRRIFVPKNDNTDDDDVDEPATLQDGKLLLFQLPPLTPFLIDPTASTMGTDSEPKVKTEPATAANSTVDPEAMPDAPATTDGAVKHDTDLDAEGKSSYRNVNENQNQTPILENDGLLTATEPQRLPAGVVGQLKVHKSGKVTLDWGGTDMEVKLGSEVDFLQDVVLVERGRGGSNSHGDDEGENAEDGGAGDMNKDATGRAYALGHVRQKLILIPDWAKLYD